MRTALLIAAMFLAAVAPVLGGQVIVLPGSSSGSSSYRVPTRPAAPLPRPRPTPTPTTPSTPLPFQPVPGLPFSPTPYANRITVTRKSDIQIEVRAPGLAISNVVLEFADGSRQRYEDVDKHYATFAGSGSHAGKPITTVWVKSGPNFSGDGPGYGQRFSLPAAAAGQ